MTKRTCGVLPNWNGVHDSRHLLSILFCRLQDRPQRGWQHPLWQKILFDANTDMSRPKPASIIIFYQPKSLLGWESGRFRRSSKMLWWFCLGVVQQFRDWQYHSSSRKIIAWKSTAVSRSDGWFVLRLACPRLTWDGTKPCQCCLGHEPNPMLLVLRICAWSFDLQVF